jgi:3-hydroxymyristoyl/3-hydroxydecanoyl-(acyl carrier protein) dehydratase
MNLQGAIDRACLSLRGEPAMATAELRFSEDDFFFEGHFPTGPVLPAVVQVGAVVELASRLLGAPQRLAEVTRAKFTNPTGPGRLLTLTLAIEAEPGRHKVRATLADGDVQISELVLRVEAQAEGARATTKS